MGTYNPHAPYILGQEWVPIRNASYVPDGVVERGYAFHLDATTVPVSGAFYVEEIPGNRLASACDFISVYPAGRETLTGPIKSVRIRPSAIVVTNPGSIDISEGLEALFSPEDSRSIIFDADTGIFSQLQVSFDTEPLAQLLLGKRIVDVKLHYTFTSPNVGNSSTMEFRIHNQSAFTGYSFPQITEVVYTSDISKVSTLSISELNPAWDPTEDFPFQRTILPWRFQELNRFRASEPAATALTVYIQNDATIFFVLLQYLEMEVVYCEETRVLYGGFRTYDGQFASFGPRPTEFYNIGAIAARLYNPATFTQGATLPAGDYVVTIYHRDIAARSVLQGAPRIHAIREYYQLPHQRGIHVRQTTTEDEQFTSEPSDILTQITLHTASQVVTGVHPYGTQYGAPIYGVRTAIQEIEDNPSAGGAPYPQVRFYARRYGNTVLPLTLTDVTTGLSTVSITVSDFDALPEIVDGWREVTLRFATPPTFPATADDVDWRWSATGELTGNQWQIMVADGPSGSWGPTPAAAATGPATYWAPLGSQVALTWQSPSISGTAQDTTSDAVLIFSQDPPAVTGLAISQLSQPITGVAEPLCADGRCVPTAIDYTRLTWTPFGVCDEFNRELINDWGFTDTNQLYTLEGGTIPDDYDVTADRGVMTLSTVNATRNASAPFSAFASSFIGSSFGGFEAKVKMRVPQISTGAVVQGRLAIGTDNANAYETYVNFNTDGTVSMQLSRIVAGIVAFLPLSTSTVTVGSYGAGSEFYVKLRWHPGGFLAGKVWNVLNAEPGGWTLTTVDTALTSFTQARLRARAITGNTNVNPQMMFSEFTAMPVPLVDGSLELQRRDVLSDDWQTIMLSTRPACLIGFSDYEARVGQLSEYRLRTLNALDFTGPWVSGSGTIPSPGVDITQGATGILIFTSNEQPSANLAYVAQFEGAPVEQFSFPEADTVSLQRLFGVDFFLAIRPLERGGERFSRVLLVNNAAIALPSLANFRDLRDLAWADLSYVCVRDELGNRWYATVVVPDGAVRNVRTTYLARIDVIEMTDVPSQVDP